MNNKNYKLIKLFAATTYAPFLDKIFSKKDDDPELREAYKLAMSGISGLYEFREGGNIKQMDSGELKFDLQKEDPNFFKIGVERLEHEQIIDKENSLDLFIKRFQKLNKLHEDLFHNKIVKFGLVKYYKVLPPIVHNKYFNSNTKYLDYIDNSKNFLLLKRDSFNINIEYTFSKKEYFLRIDINDIIKKDNYFKYSHFEDIIKYHKVILEEELEKIFGGSNV